MESNDRKQILQGVYIVKYYIYHQNEAHQRFFIAMKYPTDLGKALGCYLIMNVVWVSLSQCKSKSKSEFNSIGALDKLFASKYYDEHASLVRLLHPTMSF